MNISRSRNSHISSGKMFLCLNSSSTYFPLFLLCLNTKLFCLIFFSTLCVTCLLCLLCTCEESMTFFFSTTAHHKSVCSRWMPPCPQLFHSHDNQMHFPSCSCTPHATGLLPVWCCSAELSFSVLLLWSATNAPASHKCEVTFILHFFPNPGTLPVLQDLILALVLV